MHGIFKFGLYTQSRKTVLVHEWFKAHLKMYSFAHNIILLGEGKCDEQREQLLQHGADSGMNQ